MPRGTWRATRRGTGRRTSCSAPGCIYDNRPARAVLAQIVDEAPGARGLQGLAYVPSVQNEPVMSVMSEFPGNEPGQRILHCPWCFPRRDFRAVGDAEDVRVDRYCRL